MEALTSRWCPDGVAEEFLAGNTCGELLSVTHFRAPLEPMEDLGSLIELPKDGSCGAGSGGVDGAGNNGSSASIPVHILF